jgi:PAS domain S-box-containing protein
MPNTRILVVEDEGIIAQDIKNCLENLGYDVPEIVFTGQDALEKADQLRPDLVLMDIVLKGEMDGIETASEIKSRYNIPIVYLTAYEDDKTLTRAKLTEPLGYILKPFEERYLRSSIEMALYKHKMELKLKQSERWLSTILKSVGDAVIVTDAQGKVNFLNPKAESLIGCSLKEAYGKDINSVIKFISEDTRFPIENPVEKVLKENVALGRSNHTIMVAHDGSEVSIDHSASPIVDDKGNITGAVLVLHDVTDKIIAENALRESEKKYRNLFDYATDSIFVMSVRGDIFSVNNEACNLLGYTKDELYSLKFTDIVSDEKLIVSNFYILLKDKGGNRLETTFRKKDGTFVNVELSMRLLTLLDDEAIQVFVRDISYQKRSEKEISMLAQAIKNITECVNINDLNDNFIYVNDAFIKTYGYTAEQLIGKKIDIIRSDKNPPDLYKKIYEETLKKGWQGELYNRKGDGTDFPIYLSTSIVRDEEGKPVALIGVSTDITERIKLEHALISTERDYKNLFESSHDAIIIFNPDNDVVLEVNKSACSIYGFKREEFVGMSLNLISKDNSSRNEHLNRLLKIGDSVRFESVHYKKDGTRMLMDINAQLVDYKGKKVIVSVNRDNTEYRKVVDALISSEKRYQDLYDSAPDMYFSISKDGMVRSVNRTGSEYLGYRKEELFGNYVWKVIHPDDLRFVKDSIEKIFESKTDTGEIEFRKIKKDGTVIWVIERTHLILNDKGEPVELFINCRDITDRKKNEELVHQQKELYRAMFETNKAAKLLIDPDSGLIVDANMAACEFFGLNTESIINMSSKDLFMLSEQEILSHFSKTVSEESSYFVFQSRKPANGLRTVEVYASTLNFKEKILVFCILNDITERKRLELILTESERKYRTLAQNAPIAVTRYNFKLKSYDFINDYFIKLLGYDTDDMNKLSSDLLIHYINDADKSRIEKLMLDWSRNGYKGILHEEIRADTKDGNLLWLDIYIYADLDEEGNVEAINQLSIDITERKNVESSISEKEQKYRNLAENAPVAVTRILAKDNNYDFVNNEFTRQSGYSMEEFNKLSNEELIEMIYPDDRERIFEFYRQWEKNGHKGTQHIDYRIINREGKVVWLDTYIYADFNSFGELQAINQICIDVTESRKAHEALGESQARFKALIEYSTDMIVLLDKDMLINYTSPSTSRILNFDAQEMQQTFLLDFIHPDDLNRVKSVIQELTRSKGKLFTTQFRFRNKNGIWIWVEGTFNNFLDEQGVNSIVLNFRDITERRRAEEELKLQKSYFQQLFENSPEAIVILDDNERVVNINKGFEKLFNFSLNEIKGNNINALLVPDNLSEQGAQMTQFVLKGEVIQKETVRKRKDGSLVDVSVLAYPIMLGSELIGVYGIYHDISGRKQAEQALRTSEERYRAFVKQSSEGIWRIEFLESIPVNLPVAEQVRMAFKYGYLAECNDVVAQMYGYNSASEISGTRLNELLNEENPNNTSYLSNFINSNYRLVDSESIEHDKDGRIKYFLNNLVGIVENGSLVRAWGTRRDVTESRKAENELKLTQFRLATLLSNLPDVVLYETGAGREFISENVIDLLGYAASRFVNDRNFFPSIIHPGDYKLITEKNQEWQKAGRPGILNLEFRCRKADGTYVWLEDHMVSVKGLSEKEHMAGVLLNINERKRSEEKLKQLAEKLASSNKELEQFAYVASHDLQEPLRMVASYIQLLQRRYKGQLGAEADEFIHFAIDGVMRMKALINDLLIYSRVNTQEFPLEPVDCNQVVQQAINNLKALIEENKAILNIENLPVIKANSLQMSQVFQNLISNAVKFRSDKDPVVNITARKAVDEWLFTVSDNGIGIEKEFIDKIFIIFQRLHTYTEYPGTGIGLTICKKIIEKLGGHIWVESEPGKGSAFNFTIPINGEPEALTL